MTCGSLIVLLFATVACAAAPAATAPTLAGRVTVASAEPQCSPKGCSAPLAPVTLRFTRNGHVRTVKTGAERRLPRLAARGHLPRLDRPGRSGDQPGCGSPCERGVTRRVTFVLRLNAA